MRLRRRSSTGNSARSRAQQELREGNAALLRKVKEPEVLKEPSEEAESQRRAYQYAKQTLPRRKR